MSKIQWTDETWNPVVGCTPVSPGCLNCYAARMAVRQEAMGTPGYEARIERETDGKGEVEARRPIRIAEVRGGRPVFTGEVRCLPERLDAPLHWRKPRRVFVDSMSDLFHESVPFEFIDRVFAVMALCPQHTFQVLTKRPERMAEYLLASRGGKRGRFGRIEQTCLDYHDKATATEWPLPNVWLGTSAEDQTRLDERVPHLLKCPAAVRFLSLEPLLGAVRLTGTGCSWCYGDGSIYAGEPRPCRACLGIDWVIVGGESGPGARPCPVESTRSIVHQCKAAGVPCFVKQWGARPVLDVQERDANGKAVTWREAKLKSRAGSDPAEWPEDLRVREWPAEKN